MKPAVVLLSGGVDSATTLAIARNRGFLPYALSCACGQRHSRELESATRVAAAPSSRSEQHTSELQSPDQHGCRRLLEKKSGSLAPRATATRVADSSST